MSPTAQRPRRASPAAAARSISRDERRIERRRVAGPEPGLDERGPEERPGRAADGRHEPVPDRPEEVAGRRLGRELSEELLDGPESGREVVAVVAVAEDGVEPGQRGGMAVDGPPGAMQGGPKIGGVDAFGRRDRLALR